MDKFFFGTVEPITVWQECARALIIFPYGLLLVRLAGPRIFGKWAALDFIIAVILGSALSRALTGSAPLVPTLAAGTLLVLLHWVLARLSVRHRMFSWLLEGRAVILGTAGQTDPQQFLKHHITPADLTEALRQKNCESASEARLIAMEPSGKINVLPKT